MAEELAPDDWAMGVTAFAGGSGRGPCIQLTLKTTDNPYIQLESGSVAKLATMLQRWRMDRLPIFMGYGPEGPRPAWPTCPNCGGAVGYAYAPPDGPMKGPNALAFGRWEEAPDEYAAGPVICLECQGHVDFDLGGNPCSRQ